MLPMRCSHPPCRNIEVSGVHQVLTLPSTHATPSPAGTSVPAGSVWKSSPGIMPSSQTDWISRGSVPAPSTSSHTAILAAMSA